MGLEVSTFGTYNVVCDGCPTAFETDFTHHRSCANYLRGLNWTKVGYEYNRAKGYHYLWLCEACRKKLQ